MAKRPDRCDRFMDRRGLALRTRHTQSSRAVKTSGGGAIRRARGRYVVGQQQQGLTQNQQPNGD